MVNDRGSHAVTEPDEPGRYEIRVQGHLDATTADWFPGLTLTPQANGETLLSATLADQAALFGLLRRVRDLGLPLIAVNRVAPGPTTAGPESS